jgi:uncharacterized protein (TIGR00369 family)
MKGFVMTYASHQTTAADASSVPAASVAGLDFLKRLADGSHPAAPFARETDIWIVEAERGCVRFAAMPSKRFYNPLGTVHVSTLLDSAMGCAVHSLLVAGQAYTTVDMTVSFVRPVLEKTGKLTCEGKIIHAGGRIATAEGCVWDEAGTLVAHGSETCLVMTAPAKKSCLGLQKKGDRCSTRR